MEIESAECECCGLREDCTQEYISSVEANFDGKWLCGLCAEAVRDEAGRGRRSSSSSSSKDACGVEEAVRAHMSFCGKFRSNPAVRVADGMRQMLRRRSGGGHLSPAASAGSAATLAKDYGRSVSSPQVGLMNNVYITLKKLSN